MDLPTAQVPGGVTTAPVINITKVSPAPGTHASTNTYATSQAALGPTPGSDAPMISPLSPGKNPLLTRTRDPLPESIEKSIITPIQVNVLETLLSPHPDQSFVQKLCSELRTGVRIGYRGPRQPRLSKNLVSALQNPDIISDNLAQEVALGRTAGPFDAPPFPNFQVSPIGLVPKKHSVKFRTIFHLSYPTDSPSSINHFIPKEEFSLNYTTIDKAISAIIRTGRHSYLAKTDIESAFRQIPVHSSDWELLGMCWQGQFYFDKVLPFGLRSAPFLFNQLSDAVEWILLNHCHISFVCHILDDFFCYWNPQLPLPHSTKFAHIVYSPCSPLFTI